MRPWPSLSMAFPAVFEARNAETRLVCNTDSEIFKFGRMGRAKGD